MGCGCGKSSNINTMTTNVAQAMIDQAREQAKNEQEAMVASAAQAASNANSNQSAQR